MLVSLGQEHFDQVLQLIPHLHDSIRINRLVIPVHRFFIENSLSPVAAAGGAWRTLGKTEDLGEGEEEGSQGFDPCFDQV